MGPWGIVINSPEYLFLNELLSFPRRLLSIVNRRRRSFPNSNLPFPERRKDQHNSVDSVGVGAVGRRKVSCRRLKVDFGRSVLVDVVTDECVGT